MGLQHDVEELILKEGNVADKLRMIAAGYKNVSSISEEVVTSLKEIINPDGGVPINLTLGNPSSVKESAEILPLILGFRENYVELVDSVIKFLVSRQKSDGGFAETLNLDSYIEDRWGDTTGREWYPVGKSITWLTGKALESLCLAEYDDISRLQRARDFLLYSQNEDGHWPDFIGQKTSDPLGTGNILPALIAVGVDTNHKIYQSGRAALFHHLQESIESKSTLDMVDLIAVGKPKTDLEKKIVNEGLDLISSTQNKDGGWSQIGTKKSDPELSSILAFVVKRCC